MSGDIPTCDVYIPTNIRYIPDTHSARFTTCSFVFFHIASLNTSWIRTFQSFIPLGPWETLCAEVEFTADCILVETLYNGINLYEFDWKEGCLIRNIMYSGLMLLVTMGVTACAPSLPATTPPAQSVSSTAYLSPTPLSEATETSAPTATFTEEIPVTGHSMEPADVAPPPGKLVYDVASSGNAAPYGDTYKLNRLERPFLKDMTYVPDMDIVSFNLGQDVDWYYVSIELNGKNPNNSLGIDYGVEIDLDADGFGDDIIWAHPPYTAAWSTSTVQVLKDSNHDSAGLSSSQADASSEGNGYDTLVFDGGTGQNDDPDLAWVRMNGGPDATIQFAFKKSLIGGFFMLGVVSDAGLKDISKFDYNDHFDKAEAGSPERSKNDYPLKALYAVDNTCWEAYGIATTGFEPKLCPPLLQPTATPGHEPEACSPTFPPEDCGDIGYNPATCQCNSSP